MKKFSATPFLALAGLLMLPTLAQAHIVPGDPLSLHDGFIHPFTGLDHLLAMFGVGLWAAQHRGRALWMIPLAFVTVMAIGGIIGLTGIAMPGVEWGIAASVLVLGGLIATATRLQVSWGMLIAGTFALFHGYAHGHEMPVSVSAVGFSTGFIAATLLLHAIGIGAGLLFQKQPRLVRFAGAAIALSSVCFFLQAA